MKSSQYTFIPPFISSVAIKVISDFSGEASKLFAKTSFACSYATSSQSAGKYSITKFCFHERVL